MPNPTTVVVVAALLAVILALSLGKGKQLLRGMLRGPDGGADVFVVVSAEGKLLVYRNPNRPFLNEDRPLERVPQEILGSKKYETYYNVCWFDCGALFRCGHSFHRTPESIEYCEHYKIANCFIGKVLEQR